MKGLDIVIKIKSRPRAAETSIRVAVPNKDCLIKPGNKEGRNLELLNKSKLCYEVRKLNL